MFFKETMKRQRANVVEETKGMERATVVKNASNVEREPDITRKPQNMSEPFFLRKPTKESEVNTMTRAEAGKRGGTITSQRHGHDEYVRWGKRGGRPRLPTYDDIRQRQLLEQNKNNNKEAKDPPGELSMSQLKKRYRLRDRSSPIPEMIQAGTANETPREPSLPERKAV